MPTVNRRDRSGGEEGRGIKIQSNLRPGGGFRRSSDKIQSELPKTSFVIDGEILGEAENTDSANSGAKAQYFPWGVAQLPHKGTTGIELIQSIGKLWVYRATPTIEETVTSHMCD